MLVYVAIGILTGIYFIFSQIKKETDDFTKSIYPADATECLIIGTGSGLFWPIVITIAILRYFVNIVVKNKRKKTIKAFKDYTKEMGRIALYNNLEEILNGDTNRIRICEEVPKYVQTVASIASLHKDTYTLKDNNVEVTLEYIVRSTYIEAIVTVTNN
mgnify:CR=1 FL=1